MYLVSENVKTSPQHPRFSTQGYGWVRVAPLVGVGESSPYLHNGSVPTLRDLLNEPTSRPQEFPVGSPEQGFILDTTLPGNFNGGHDFGADLSPEEKSDIVRYLESLP